VCVQCFDETQQNLEAIKSMGVFNRLTKLACDSYNRALRILPSTVSGLNHFTKRPLVTKEAYQVLASEVSANSYPEIDRFEQSTGYAIEQTWLHDLALHTQVVVKKSPLCYAHGRLLYSALSRYLATIPKSEGITILETGTARGFSSLCMARALEDSDRIGKVITCDVLPHRTAMYWNCIDDWERKKTREELLRPWGSLADKYIFFMQGDTQVILPRLNMGRVHFAFLDGAHSKADVLFEFGQVTGYQKAGDVIVFDDYTPSQFPGVVAAIEEVCDKYGYDCEKTFAHSGRGYAVAIKQ
jgi:predicted O-methyltransferase YrrM